MALLWIGSLFWLLSFMFFSSFLYSFIILCHIGDFSGYFGCCLLVYFAAFVWGLQTPPLAEMGDSLLSEPTLTAEPAPSPAAAAPAPAAAEPGVSLAPPTSTAAATSPGTTNMDLLGGQWASRKFSMKDSLCEAQP